MAKVSVIIPVYNGAATIGRALASVFAQTFTDYEIVVVNDGSTDDTASVLAGYGDKIRTILLTNSGPSAARNAGVSASSGEYLAFLDDDDEWMPRKLELSIPVLDRELSASWCTPAASNSISAGEAPGLWMDRLKAPNRRR